MGILRDVVMSGIAGEDITGGLAVYFEGNKLNVVDSAAHAIESVGIATGDFKEGQNASYFHWSSARMGGTNAGAVPAGSEVSVGTNGKLKVAASNELVRGIVPDDRAAATVADDGIEFITNQYVKA